MEQARAGLCERCAHVKRLQSARGSTFYLCRYSEQDARYAKYPRLPVQRCEAFREQEPGARPADTRDS